MHLRAPLLAVCASAVVSAQAADIGGWMEHRARADLQRDDCTDLPAQAARAPRAADGSAQLYYAAGLCYLYSAKLARDPVAAGAWLALAAELDHPLARRALVALQGGQAHPTTPHCHDLGNDRQLCHGSAPQPEERKSP